MITCEVSLTCDYCSHTEKFGRIKHAIDFKSKNGWGSKNVDGVWKDVCPNCLAEADVQPFQPFKKKKPKKR